ncbi:GOLPH3/VPS74 family protein [Amnibacterium kyonggiense]|uniref:Golgi phosphoprotein 3 GPP34 n=1 Tax=Amnibacterium kyonggiense TaxID=595671 RepID=A0A4R7FIN4_9MICO|nr:GPP34 family phosphoprotein [Amnibacterium kyonggiense]TDS76131.1 Golgi phosphoprotein 3 GPP34 [Amnibacterium kyonggiense]
MAALLAEDLLLLLLDDESGTTKGLTIDARVPLGAAVLAELAIAGAVELEPATSRWRRPTVRGTEVALEDDVLADARRLVDERPRTADDLAARIGTGLKDRLADRLAAHGVLDRQDDRVLGLFPRTRWPARSFTEEAAVRARLRDVVVLGAAPDERTAALAGILQALGRLAPTLGLRGAEAREAKRRVAALAEGDWASKVVRDAVQAAIVAASTAATTAATVTAISS